MSNILIFIIALLSIIIFNIFQNLKEQYTDTETLWAKEILNYILADQTNFSGYSQVLITNSNTSTNLAKYNTYKKFVQLNKTTKLISSINYNYKFFLKTKIPL